MDKEKGLIDHPDYKPDERVVFPATGGKATDNRDRDAQKHKSQKQEGVGYAASFPATDPSLTTPGGKNLYDPDTRLTVEEVQAYNPNPDLHE